MKSSTLIFVLSALCIISLTQAFDNSTFAFSNQRFTLNGKTFKIVAGEIHYSRIPVEYWRHRIQMVRALGCNTLSVYIMWNYHELSPGQFDFQTENKNLAEFLTIAKEENMYVLIRPGPYVCAEWDFGGHPYWLLKDPKMELRSQYEGYVSNYNKYLEKVAEVIEPFQINYGGPIIMLQIENQYGYWGKDNSFPVSLLNSWIQTGRIVVPYYTADPPKGLQIGAIEGLAVGLNPGVTASAWDQAQNDFPDGPWLSSETYPGWLTHWGEKWATQTVAACEDEFNYLCEEGQGSKSFSIYMAHGGTNFGFTAGANFDLGSTGTFQPDVTSYDYDAPINEQGAKTTKFTYIRGILGNCLSRTLSKIPDPIPTMTIPEFKTTLWASLWENLPTPVTSTKPITMENLNQPHGFVLYSANIDAGTAGKDRNLFVQDVHDYANVYTNGNFVGSLDRRIDQYTMNISSTATKLDILVEALGHINFSIQMNTDRQGITDKVYVDDKEITGWNIYSLPFDSDYIYNLRSIFDPKKIKEGLFFRAVVTLTDTNDTYLDMSRWSKGFVWVNGRNLGRYWGIGPQYRLYCPGVWLKKGANEIIVFDMHRVTPDTITGYETLK